jgi:hypothetical protein
VPTKQAQLRFHFGRKCLAIRHRLFDQIFLSADRVLHDTKAAIDAQVKRESAAADMQIERQKAANEIEIERESCTCSPRGMMNAQ